MARVDFYILGEAGDLARRRFACRLAEKAYSLDHRVHIVVDNREDASQVDELLWTFRDGSFVPHEVVTATADPVESPVTIGFGDRAPGHRDLLINLGSDMPAELQTYQRIAEIVSADDAARQRGRQRFVDYRNQGHTLDTHKLQSTA